MTMTTTRADELLRNQTAIARKVYDVVPNKPEHITPQEVVGKLRAIGIQIALPSVSGILADLQSDRLVFGSGDWYWRAPVTLKLRRQAQADDEPRADPPPPSADPPPPPAPLDCFAGIATRLRSVGRELNLLADEIETAALATEQARESAAQDGERLRQLRQLLMGSV